MEFCPRQVSTHYILVNVKVCQILHHTTDIGTQVLFNTSMSMHSFILALSCICQLVIFINRLYAMIMERILLCAFLTFATHPIICAFLTFATHPYYLCVQTNIFVQYIQFFFLQSITLFLHNFIVRLAVYIRSI